MSKDEVNNSLEHNITWTCRACLEKEDRDIKTVAAQGTPISENILGDTK